MEKRACLLHEAPPTLVECRTINFSGSATNPAICDPCAEREGYAWDEQKGWVKKCWVKK